MAGRVTTYDPARVLCSLGPVLLNGFAEGDAITVERASDEESNVAGVDGNVVRVKNASRLATVTVRLQGGSPANVGLRAMRALANPLLPSLDQGAFLMKDLNSGVQLVSDVAWVSSEPLPSLSQDAPVMEWKISCAFLQVIPIVALS